MFICSKFIISTALANFGVIVAIIIAIIIIIIIIVIMKVYFFVTSPTSSF